MKAITTTLALLLAISLTAGCAAFRISVRDRAPEAPGYLTDKYDQRDLLAWSRAMAADLLAAPLAGRNGSLPIIVPLGIQNRTQTHLDTVALSDTIATELLNSGRIRLVNAQRRDDLVREQGYQLAQCTEETRAAIGRQLGADLMLTGALTEITTESGRQVRVSKTQDVYYQLTVQLTDLETGLVVASRQQDRLRRSSKPIIGW